jgi:UDP-N-acetylmuramoyl-tripeptide--D-alanyl-D-alanine ligase
MIASVIRAAALAVTEPATFALSAETAEQLTGGRWHGRSRVAQVQGAAIDSRRVAKGCIFACLPGARVDGHDFAATAVGDGAALIIANRPLDLPVPVLEVADTAAALGALAGEFRRRHRGATWIGVTGSSGKTTVKELIAAACAGHAPGLVHATEGNLNNHLGVPVTVLNTPADARYVVIEMGANHRGEIAMLAGISQPDVAVITTLGPAHLEGFGGLLGVAASKAEIFAALKPGAPAFIGVEGIDATAQRYGFTADELLGMVDTIAAKGAGAPRRLGGEACPLHGEVGEDSVRLRTVGCACHPRTMSATVEAVVPLLGRHNLSNAALAWHAAVAAGVPPQDAAAGLEQAVAAPGRLALRRLGQHLVLDDTYNANPLSMVAGLEVLAARAGRHLAVLGQMGELGSDAEVSHRQVGAEAARLGIPLIAVNAPALAAGYREAGGVDLSEAADVAAGGLAATAWIARAAAPVTVLVKASRSAGLERVVAALERALGVGSSC